MNTSTSTRSTAAACILLALVVLSPLTSHGQGLAGGRIEGSFKFLPIPYLNYTRSIGFQVGALPMAMFNPVKNDTISPSSLAGLFGMYSGNESWFGMGFAKMFFGEDDWRVVGAGGTGSVNFQFFLDAPVNGWIPYNTEMDMAFVQLQRRIYQRLYGGVSYVYLNFKTSLDAIPDDLKNTLHGLGLNLELDHRSNVWYPRAGFTSGIDYFTYPSAFGNETDSDKIELDYNHYFSMRREHDVLAGRFFAGLGLGNLSFNQQFIVGRRSDIRGYTQGAYRGNYLLALQGEYRWNFHERLGAVGFLGVATVFDAINADDDGKLLPGIGAGFRYTVVKETGMNVGVDIAAGVDDWGVYFRIGEAF